MNLVKQDKGGDGASLIRVPKLSSGLGEVVLGRNALCAVVDPLVSRRQASVKWDPDGDRWVFRALANGHCRHRPNR